jgi:hypothetical protein
VPSSFWVLFVSERTEIGEIEMSIKDLNKREKAALELIINGVQEILKEEKIENEKLNEYLESWVKGNDLHPETVVTVNRITIGKNKNIKTEICGKIEKIGKLYMR